MGFMTRHRTSLWLPDDRLVLVELEGHCINVTLREGFIHPDLVRDVDEFGRHMSRSSVFELASEADDDEPALPFGMHFDAAPYGSLPLQTHGLQFHWSGGAPHIEFLCHYGMMSKALRDELNEYGAPEFYQLLRPIQRRRTVVVNPSLDMF